MLASCTMEHAVTSAAVPLRHAAGSGKRPTDDANCPGLLRAHRSSPTQLACMQFTELQSSLQRGFDSMSVCNRISQQALPEGLTMLSTGFLQIWLVSWRPPATAGGPGNSRWLLVMRLQLDRVSEATVPVAALSWWGADQCACWDASGLLGKPAAAHHKLCFHLTLLSHSW